MTARQARRAKRRKASIQESRGLLMFGNRTPGKSERARRYTREWQRNNPGGIVMVYQGDREPRALAIMHMHARGA